MGRKPKSKSISAINLAPNDAEELEKFHAVRLSVSKEVTNSSPKNTPENEKILEKEAESDDESTIDDSDDIVSDEDIAELEHLVPFNSNSAEDEAIKVTINHSTESDSHNTDYTTSISHELDLKNRRESVLWSEPTNLLLDSHSYSQSVDSQINQQKFTTNYNKSGCCSCITRCLRSLLHTDDPYVRMTLIATKDSKTTNCVHGVEQNAMWTKKDKNTLRFFIPTHYNDGQLPMKMLIELWDKDYSSFDDFMGSKVVDVRPATNSVDTSRKLQLKLRDGKRFIGILTLNVSYSESLNDKEQKKLNKELKRQKKYQDKILKKKRKELFGNFTDLEKKKLTDTDKEQKYGMLKCEILTFEGAEMKESNLSRFWNVFGGILSVLTYLFAVTIAFYWLESGQNWSFIDTIYFTVVTSTTVGYGDLSPTTKLSKILACIVGIVAQLTILVAFTNFASRIIQYRKDQVLHRRQSAQRRDALIKRLGEERKLRTRDSRIQRALSLRKESNGNGNFLYTHSYDDVSAFRKFWDHYAASLSIFLLWIICWVIYFVYLSKSKLELFDAVYVAIISATTVGYGDVPFEHKDHRIFVSCVVLIGVAALANISSSISAAIAEKGQTKLQDNILESALTTIEDLKEFDECHDTHVITKHEFLQGMLLKMKLVDRKVIDQINDKFIEYGGIDGIITVKELQHILREKTTSFSA